MPDDDFYKDKAWMMLMDEIHEIKADLAEAKDDLATIKNKMAWVFGMAAGITFLFNIAWQWILAKVQSGKSLLG